MNEYDISSIFKDMEDYLLSSMSRNMKKHTDWEHDEGFKWEMWQARQLESLNEYRIYNKKYVGKQSSVIRLKIEELLKQSNEHGGMHQEEKILNAIKKGFKPGRVSKGIKESFFKLNQRKLDALVKSVNSDVVKASNAMLRMVNDEYRKTIFKAQVFANTGTMTTDQAIDMATKDFLSKGINCIEYSNGTRVNIASYAEMAIRAANKKARLQGEGAKRAEWGIHTVLISKYGACSNICLPWQGRVYVDDVWSGGTAEEAERLKLPLLSTAIAGGLFHPNCKHTMSTYFKGITTIPSKTDVKGTRENSDVIAKQRYNERQIRKYKRLENGSLDETNRSKYETKRKEWQSRQRDLLNEHPEVHRNYKRESLRGVNKIDTTANDVFNSKSVINSFEDDKLDIPFKNKKLSGKVEIPYNEVDHIFTNGKYEVDDSMKMAAKEYQLANGVKVYTPANLNAEKQPISVIQINEVLSEFPKEITNSINEIEIVDYRNPQDEYFSRLRKKNFISAAIGGDRKITFFPSLNNRSNQQIKEIVYHESGHILEDEYFKLTGINISESKDYLNAMRYDEKHSNLKSVTRYGGFNNREDVAESIKLYNLDSENFKNRFPGRYKFIKEWFKWIRENSQPIKK